jgi:hypothetical protein
MQRYEGLLREAYTAAQRRDSVGFRQAAEDLTDIETVQVEDDVLVPVDNQWLDAALDEPEPDFSQVAERLGALLDALAQPGQNVPPDADERLRDILSRPPFTDETSDSLLSRFLDWLFDILDRLFSPLAEAGAGSGSLLSWILVIICGGILAGVLVYLLLSMRHSLASEAQAREARDPEASLTAASALQQAGTLASGGDYRTAVRYLYLSSLLWLDEQGMLHYDRALTNQEHLARLVDNPDLRARLVPIVQTFDRVWYGHIELDAESFTTYKQQVEALHSARR